MTNVTYNVEEGIGYGRLSNGMTFTFDRRNYDKIRHVKWYASCESGRPYMMDCRGRKMHSYLFHCPAGYEIDHISLDTLDNRSCNIRVCTHQQNQMNQPLQKNNTSGVAGVSWYAARNKFRARIKVAQREIHLGYFDTFEDAVRARNIGMRCMFGAYGRYDDIGKIPFWIEKQVVEKCIRFVELAQNSAFFDFWDLEVSADGE